MLRSINGKFKIAVFLTQNPEILLFGTISHKITYTLLFLFEKSFGKRFQNLIFSKKQTKLFKLIFLKRKNNCNHDQVLKNVKKNDLWNQ